MRWTGTYFKVVALVFVAFGAVASVMPDLYIALLDVAASAGGRLWGRAFGAASLGLGAIFWMIDPAIQRERRIGAIGAVLVFGVTALTDAISVVGGDLPTYGWGFVVFNGLMVFLALILQQAPVRQAGSVAP